MIEQDRLKELLHYNCDTGIFTNRSNRGPNARKGEISGAVHSGGYITINLDGKAYLAHRLAWLYIYGYMPENDIDHKDMDKQNNTIKNLREASKQCNARNSKIRDDNKSGVTGVCFDKLRNKWMASITVNQKNIALGRFLDIDSAVKKRWCAEVDFDFPSCKTSSPAYLYLKERSLI